MMPLFERPDWFDQAECRNMPVSMFYPERGDNHGLTAAKAVCRRCQVQAECLTYCLNNNDSHGVWGGMAIRDRIRIKQHRRMA